jgi:light-regulated signal transduction histidine kinase (bacteriophytochrome)
MMFIISHKVRSPVANILGISYLLEENENKLSEESSALIQMLSQSALSLNALTEELATYIHTKRVSQQLRTFPKLKNRGFIT